MDSPAPFSARLHRTIFIHATLVIVILTLLISFFAIRRMYQRLMEVEEMNLSHTAAHQAMAAGEWVLRARELALQIASRTQMRDKLDEFNAGRLNLTELVGYSKPRLMEALLLAEELVGISRFDKNKTLVVQSGVPLMEGTKPVFPSEEQSCLMGLPQQIGGSPYGVLGVSITDTEGRILGTDFLLMETTRLERIVSDPSGHDRGLQTILGFKGEKGFKSVFNIAGKGDPGKISLDVPQELSPYLAKAIGGKSGVVEVGRQMLAYAPVEGCSWGCLVRIDKKAFQTPVINSLIRTFSIVLSLLLIGLLVLWFLLRPVNKRITHQIRDLEAKASRNTAQARAQAREQEKTEEALKALEENHRGVLSRVQDPVIVYDPEGRVSHLNPAFSRVFGWSLTECLGKRLDYTPPNQTQEPREIASLPDQGDEDSGLRTRRYDKRGLLIKVTLFPVRLKDPGTGSGGTAAVLRPDPQD